MRYDPISLAIGVLVFLILLLVVLHLAGIAL